MTKSQDLKAIPYWLVLNRLPYFGPKKFQALLQIEPRIENWFQGTRPTPELVEFLSRWKISSQFDWHKVELDLEFARQPEQSILCWQDERYPLKLKQISSPPPLIFVQGAISNLHTDQIAMVGSRHPTPQGEDNAFAFAAELAQLGLTITSGLAMGIDSKSHQGALSVKGKTIAVLGQGLPQIYPKRHTELAQSIVAQGGTIICEYPTHSGVKPQNFPRRNRLISALSLGVLVVEATVKSGSLITAMYALEQGKEVFAIPGSIHNPLAKGCHHLMREGAKCVETIDHIIEEINALISQPLLNHRQMVARVASKLPSKEDLTLSQKRILSQIGFECTPIDRVVERTGLAPDEILPLLSELELLGKVSLISGGYIRI